MTETHTTVISAETLETMLEASTPLRIFDCHQSYHRSDVATVELIIPVMSVRRLAIGPELPKISPILWCLVAIGNLYQ